MSLFLEKTQILIFNTFFGVGFFRIIFAIAVIMAHAGTIFGYLLLNGTLAVECFFIISGFYMALILSKKYVGKGAVKLFFINRFLRLFPIYWVILVATVAINLLALALLNRCMMGMEVWIQYWPMTIGSVIYLIFTNIFIFFQDWVWFLGFNPVTHSLFLTTDYNATSPAVWNLLFVPQAWTISLELIFYILAPFLIKLKTKYLIAIIFLSFSMRILIYSLGMYHDPWDSRFFPIELSLFLIGILCYRVYENIEQYRTYFQILNLSVKKIFVEVLLLLFIGMTIFYNSAQINFIPGICKYWAYLLCLAILLPFLFSLSKNSKLDRQIGELSYPIYISHYLLIGITTFSVQFFTSNTDFRNIVLIAICIAAAITLNYYVQAPIDKYRERKVQSEIINNHPQ